MNHIVTVKNSIGLLLACLGTFVLSWSGFDAWYFTVFHDSAVAYFFGLAGIVGFFVPVFLCLGLWIVGFVQKNKRMIRVGSFAAIAGIGGWFLSSLLKAFTGRVPLPYGGLSNILEWSQTFQFGFLKGGIFWGWPSSHTTTAFAMSVTIALMYKDKKWVGYVALLYAFYIGLGASMNFHWFSDFFAGMILGSIIGYLCATLFLRKTRGE